MIESEHSALIHLASDLDTLWRRTRDDASRPLLDVDDPRAALAALATG